MTFMRSLRDMLLLVGLLPLCEAGSAAVFQACSIERDQPDALRQEVLRDTASLVMLKAYDDLQAAAAALVPALEGFDAAPSLDTLHTAQATYRAARSVWHQTQAFY